MPPKARVWFSHLYSYRTVLYEYSDPCTTARTVRYWLHLEFQKATLALVGTAICYTYYFDKAVIHVRHIFVSISEFLDRPILTLSKPLGSIWFDERSGCRLCSTRRLPMRRRWFATAVEDQTPHPTAYSVIVSSNITGWRPLPFLSARMSARHRPSRSQGSPPPSLLPSGARSRWRTGSLSAFHAAAAARLLSTASSQLTTGKPARDAPWSSSDTMTQ